MLMFAAMLARVLFVLLAGVPVCRGAKGAAYSAYYDADGDVQNADFYDSYNDEIKSPQKMTTVMESITGMKRRDLDDVRTRNPEEIIDVKGVINNILQGKKPEYVRGRRTARDYSDSYNYIENSVDVGPEVKPDKGLVPQKWQSTVEVQRWSTVADDQEHLGDSSSHATEQHWSFVYQPDTSTAGNNDIVAEVKKMIPVRDADIPSRSSVDYGRPTQEVQTWVSTQETEETEDTLMYPLESTTYSNSDIQAEVRKLVQHWSASGPVNLDESTTPYSNSDMQAEVRKLVQHWSASGTVNQETSSYNIADMRVDVNHQNRNSPANVQHRSHSSNIQQERRTSIVQHRGPSMAKEKMNQQQTGMQTELKKWQPWNPILEHKHWSAPDNVQHWSATDNVHHQTPSVNVQHWSASDNIQHHIPSDSVQHWSATDNVQHRILSDNVHHQTPSLDVQHWSASDNVQHRIPSDNVELQNPSMNVQYWNPSMNVQQQDPSMNIQHHIPSDNVQPRIPSVNVQHWSASDNVQHHIPSDNVQHGIPSDNVQHHIPSVNVQRWSASDNVQHHIPSDYVQHRIPSDNVQHWSVPDNVQYWNFSDNAQQWSSSNNAQHWSAYSNVQHRIPSDNVQRQNPSMNVQYWNPSMNVQQQDPSMNIQHHIPSDNVQHQSPSINVQYQDQYQDLTMNVYHWSPDNVQHQNASANVQHWRPTIDVHRWTAIAANNQENETFTASKTDPPSSHETDMDTDVDIPRMLRVLPTTTLQPNDTIMNETTTLQPTTTTTVPTTTTTVPTTTTTVPTTTTPSTPRMDIDAIMAIISNLTYDYEWNLTGEFNKTIIEHGVPTCPWEKWGPGGAWTATTYAGTTLYPWNFENTSVVSKCFVCGLHAPEIPRNAFCSDAFAGDFLPLMPIDPRSRGKIAGFRKYCRYIDAQNYVENPDEPRAIYGRFTGGCAVRWTDITGVYTQRTCRSKYRPLLGKHIASKRMAKLELALVNVENGCIISPMATLLPVSRGISLYARFHACVCSSNWCNRATIEQASLNSLVTILLAYWLVHYP